MTDGGASPEKAIRVIDGPNDEDERKENLNRWHAAFDLGQLFIIDTTNGGQEPVGHLFEVTFPGPAWLNGGELGTEAGIFIVPTIATLAYVACVLSKANVNKRP